MRGKRTEQRVINIGLVVRPVPPVRDHFDESELARLVASIRENGILVPLLVRPRGDKFEVVDGDRRLAAAFEAGVREIPVVVRDLTDSETHIQRMLANLDRHDTDPLSEAKYIAQIVASGALTIPAFAKKLGRTIGWVEGRLMIAEMPGYMKDALSDQKVPLGVCMELFQITDENTRERYFMDALRSGMTVHTAHINRLMVMEAITALEERGEVLTEESVPGAVTVPRVRCAYTGETLPVTATRMVRVGVETHEKWQRDLKKTDPS